MGTLVIPSGFAEIDVEFDISATQEAHVVFGVENTGNVSAQAIADAVYASFVSANVEAFLSATRNLVSVKSKLNESGVLTIGENTSGIIGLASGADAPPQVAVLFRKITGLAGHANTGRMYWPYVAESQVTADGSLDNTAFGVFNTLAADLVAELFTNSVPMVILHGGLAPAPPTFVANMTAERTVATQRRRLR